MTKLKYLLRNINIINIILTTGLVLFIVFIVLPSLRADIEYSPPALKDTNDESEGKGPAAVSKKAPFQSDYVIISEKNLFHPDRKITERVSVEPNAKRPAFMLYGTLIMDEMSIAYLADMNAAAKTTGRDKRQVALKKEETLSGYTLKEIEFDRVVMVQGEDTITVYLDDPKKERVIKKGSVPVKAASLKSRRVSSQQPRPKSKAFFKPVKKPSLNTTITPPSTGMPPLPSEKQGSAKEKLLDIFRMR